MKFVSVLVLSVCLLSCCFAQPRSFVSPAVRLVNGIANSPLLDVYLDNHLIFSQSSFGSASAYVNVGAGSYDIRLVDVLNGQPLYTIKNVTLSDQVPHYTFVAQGSLDIDFADSYPFALAVLIDDNDSRTGVARTRFYHCSVASDNVNVLIDDDSIFGNVAYAEYSSYKSVPAGQFTVSLVSSATGETLVDEEIDFDEETMVSMFFIGESDQYYDSDRPNLLVVVDTAYVPYVYYSSTNPASVLSVSFMVLLGLVGLAVF